MKQYKFIIIFIVSLLVWIGTFQVLDMDYQKVMFNDKTLAVEGFGKDSCDRIDGIYKRDIHLGTEVTIKCFHEDGIMTSYHFLIVGEITKEGVYTSRITGPYNVDLGSYSQNYDIQLSHYTSDDLVNTWTNIGLIRVARYISAFVTIFTFFPAINTLRKKD